jgi:hypothetical protein
LIVYAMRLLGRVPKRGKCANEVSGPAGAMRHADGARAARGNLPR